MEDLCYRRRQVAALMDVSDHRASVHAREGRDVGKEFGKEARSA
jgi:hypothetical protein